MKIKLNWLKLRNFKGAKKLEVIADGESLNVYGDNGTYKTTIADSENWLLFDKDSQGKSTFDIKTLDENNEPIHHLEHEVEGCYSVDGKQLILKKTYHEVWKKKRGSATKVFDGHTTDYEINEVPKAAGEYKEYISSIIDEDTFKLLTNPSYFNEQLKWEDRRKILIEVCGSVSDEDVIDSDKKLAGLKEIISDRTLDEHKKVIKSKMAKVKDKIKDIPTRIDEVDRGLPDIAGIDVDKIKANIKVVKAKQTAKEKELIKVESGGGIAEKEKQLAELQKELMIIENDHTAKYNEHIRQKGSELSVLKEAFDEVRRDGIYKTEDIRDNERKIVNLGKERKELQAKWYQANDDKRDMLSECWTGDTKCYACDQELPEGQIIKAKKKYNKDKAEKIEKIENDLASINKQGKDIVTKIEDLKNKNAELEKNVKSLEQKKADYEQQIEEYKKEIADLEEKAEQYQEDFQYKKKLAEAEGIETSIRKLKTGNHDEIIKIQDAIYKLEDEIKGLEIKLSYVDDYNKKQERIKELTAQQKKLAAEYEKLEGEAFLVEEFERKQASMLEDKINGEFEIAEFKLFDKQVNGGISQTCETIVKGVPYSTGLNAGHQTMAGIDIINKLSDHYDFYAPIFADNAEGVSRIPGTKSQLIKLYKPATFKELNDEIKNLLIEKYGSEEKAKKAHDKKIGKLRIEREGV